MLFRSNEGNKALHAKLDFLTREIQNNKTMLERALNEIKQNNKEIEDIIINSVEIAMDEIRQQNNERFDMLSEQIEMLANNKNKEVVIPATLNSKTIIPRGAYTKQELDDKALMSMTEQELTKLRNNISSTKCRNKDKDTTYEMCIANIDKINKRLQELRQH